ncbi:MAG: Gfo/Idh/MocA family oxidoreductase [Pirellulaceae bacterium]|nr:Gfo/Idh/MocA family oxidoreductase [Pirellulaceae bacterium]
MLGICVIGSGRAGLIHARNFAAGRIAGARLVALVEPVAEARQKACQELELDTAYAGHAQALADPRVDAVVVATPTTFHRAIVVAAAQAGKHILCEKPMATNARECDEMIAAAAAARVRLQIGFMRRFDAGFVAAKQRVDAGEIGQVVLVKSLTHGPTTPKPWMYDIRTSLGPLAEVNSHDIDSVRWFTGSEFEEVYAIGGNYRSPDARQQYPDFYDNVILVARMRNGMQGSISGAQGVKYGYDARCEILGEKGLITVGGLAANAVVSHTADGSRAAVVQSWMNLFLDAYRAEDEDFVRCVLENREPRAGGRDGKAAVMVVNAGNQSIAERTPVRLGEPRPQ